MTSSDDDYILIMIMSQHINIIVLYFQSHVIVFAAFSWQIQYHLPEKEMHTQPTYHRS